jgi:endonuclease/exonuclease/phosphatase family metal-dependent hydrolase
MACSQHSAKPNSNSNLRLMSYNIRNAKGMDNVLDCQRIADIINREAPHTIAVQEIDSMTTRSGQRYILGEIAKHTNMHATYAPAIDHQGGKYGIGILSREKPLAIEHHPLPGREESRMLLLVEFKKYYFCCTHLSLTEEDRLTSIGIITDELSKLDKPVMIAGDFNAEPEEESMKVMAKNFAIFKKDATSSYTFPANKPDIEIDYICLLKSDKVSKFEVLEHSIIDAPVESDHRPLVAEVKIN